ncbi:putative holliday junction resolvase [Humidesulfovibrio mexicanus]|uniref:Putative pre-16S rRNA nuclease n=1 Tax=Humidesulfovibrio mexicanus TaxID=147047 RepID=A0A239AMX5_9BACT|nr:Holliday junction resolvase RuvX [Humidesulfovibrio mexicanus]SNR96909.1 putative holliday junction resolvase [Humidesulfovibrio mexicanus]
MRVLGIDYGQVRVGLAITDPEGRMAFPRPTIARTTRDSLFEELATLIRSEGIDAVVVGLPLTLDGEDSLTTRQARNFAASLARRIDAPVHLMDERLSSAAADAQLKEAGLCSRKRKTHLDSQAAVQILETWIGQNPV